MNDNQRLQRSLDRLDDIMKRTKSYSGDSRVVVLLAGMLLLVETFEQKIENLDETVRNN